MTSTNHIKNVYCLGIGGIGVSALARYFKAHSLHVGGYDLTPSRLTDTLIREGMDIHFSDSVDLIGPEFRNPGDTLIIFTPAVPSTHNELNWFKCHGFTIQKRAEVLGTISQLKKTIGISGTHGKTSVTTMTAHLLTECDVSCDAFMGGISKNYGTNLLLRPNSKYLVAEADEYDRSFLHLHPFVAVVTAADADHLDIYGTHQAVKESFEQYIHQVQPGGFLIVKKGVPIRIPDGIQALSYSLSEPADYFATNIQVRDGLYHADLSSPNGMIHDITIGVPGLVNVENAIAAMAVALTLGCPAHKVKKAMSTFKGVQRRFDCRFKSEHLMYIDDYGHHPEELRFTIHSVRELYPGRHITGIFQPHLFSRTFDLHREFARSLSLLDRVILLDIYPAREKPMEGVTSELIMKDITSPERYLCTKIEVLPMLERCNPDILLTMGAGDIDQLVPLITHWCQEQKR